MLRNHDDGALLKDILNAANEALAFINGMTYEEFEQNALIQRAVERELEIIGIAAGNVSVAYKETHPELPWREMVGQRNVLAHNYGEIEERRIWQVLVIDLPTLIRQLDTLLSSS